MDIQSLLLEIKLLKSRVESLESSLKDVELMNEDIDYRLVQLED